MYPKYAYTIIRAKAYTARNSKNTEEWKKQCITDQILGLIDEGRNTKIRTVQITANSIKKLGQCGEKKKYGKSTNAQK